MGEDEAVRKVFELLTQANWLLRRRFHSRLRRDGFSMTEMAVLRLVSHSGGERLTDLAQALGLPPSTMTSLIDGLEAKGYVARVRSDADRRCIRVTATDKLVRAGSAFQETVQGEAAAILRGLPGERLRRLAGDLEALVSLLRGGGEEDGGN